MSRKITAKERHRLDQIEAEALQRSVDDVMAQAEKLRERGLWVSLLVKNEKSVKAANLAVRRDFVNTSVSIYVTPDKPKG